MDSKKIIEKLLKVASNQQKILTKLAQSMGETPVVPAAVEGGATLGWDDVSNAVAAKLKAVAPNYAVSKAQLSSFDGSLRGTLIYPKGDTKYHEVSKALKTQLAGQPIKTNDDKTVQVTKDIANISFIGTT